jgi:hypothetical protein
MKEKQKATLLHAGKKSEIFLSNGVHEPKPEKEFRGCP